MIRITHDALHELVDLCGLLHPERAEDFFDGVEAFHHSDSPGVWVVTFTEQWMRDVFENERYAFDTATPIGAKE